MDSLSRQPDLDRLLYHSTVAVSTPNAISPALDGAGHTAQATAATVLSPEKADAPAAGEREEIQIQLVDKLQVVTSPAEAAAIGGGAGETLDATSQLEEAGAALDLAQRRALLLGRTKQRHVCLQCGRECPSKHKLKRHLSTHSEQRPYNCHLCGKSFKWTEYLAKHMRTQHPGVEVPATFVAHGNSASPARDCASPPTPTTTSTPSSLTSTPSHSQLTPYKTSSTGGTDGSGTNCSGADLSEGITVGSVSLATGAIDENPIGCDTVFESTSHCPVSPHVSTTAITTSHRSPMHTSLLTKSTTLSEAPPPTNELLSSQLSASSQVQQHRLQPTQQQLNLLRQSSQQSVPSPQNQPMTQQQQVLQQELLNHHQLQEQQQQEQKKQQQKLLQQQIQQHQMHQLQQQALQQKQQQQQTLRQMSQQGIQQQPSSHLVQPAQDLLQTTEQMYAASSPSAGALSPAQTQQLTAETSTQMGTLQATHPLSHHTHVMSSEASIGYVGPAGENYDSAPASTSVVYTNDSFQDSSSSQVFTSPVYNTQSVTQVYQVPSQSQSTLTTENFDNFTAPADNFSSTTANYASTMTSLPPQQLGFTGSITQQPGTQEGGLGNMNVQSHQTPDSNILHMQAQITQSAYELQSVQMQSTDMTSSMQTYDNSAMMQTSDNFQDGSGAYQEGTTMYQEGTSTYQTGTNTYQIQEGTGYQEGTSYQETGQNLSLSTSYTNTGLPATSVGSLSQDISRQVYSVPSQSQPYKQEDSSQPQLTNFSDAGSTVSEVIAYSQQIQAADSLIQQQTNVYTSVTPNTFQQTPLPGSSSVGLQQPAATEPNVLLSQQSQMLSNVTQIETVVTGPPQTGTTSGLEDATLTGSEQSSGKSNKKSHKPKVSIGIQCEVGPETFRVLKEEEAQAKVASSRSSSSQETTGPNPNPLVQKHGNASLLLNSVGSPPVNDLLNTSSPSVNTSGSETTHTGLSDKVIHKYPCEVSNCSKAYVHRKDLIRHMTLRHGKSPQKLQAVVIETPEKPYTCHVGGCQKSYFHQKDLRRHQRQCHSVVDNSHLTEAVEMTDADGKVMVRFPCDFPGCQRSYVHKKDLVRHKRVYHKDESKKPSIPVPVKFSEADLKRIRHEEKAFHERDTPDAKKLRLDSTGSMMSGGEDQSQFTEVSTIQISENVELGQLSTSPTPVVDYKGQNQVSYETLSSTEVEPTQLTNTLTLGLSQQASERPIAQQASQQPGVHLPTILRRQRQSSNGQLGNTTSQDQQLANGITLRNLASLMLGGLQGNTSNGGSGTSFDITQQAVAAFSSPGNSEASSQPTESQQALAAAAAVAQFDPAAIISALTNVVNNPSQIQDMTQSPSLEQQQVVSMENVANALQFLTSTSSNA